MVLLRHALLLLVALIAGCTFQFLEEGPYLEVFESNGRSAVELKGVDGDVRVQGSGIANEVLIRGTRRALGSTRERAKENLESVHLEPRAEGAQLTLEIDPPLELVGLLELELIGPSVFPRDLGLTVEVTEGDLSVDNLRGEITLETGEGDVSVSSAGPGPVSVVTGNGDVTVSALGVVTIDADGRATVEVPGVDQHLVDVVTAGGAIMIEIVPQAIEIAVHTDGGELTVDPALGLESVGDGNGGQYLMTDSEEFEGPWKMIKVSSHGGDIDVVALPAYF